MARYWVGGSGNINDVTHWSLTSGGISGASLPTSLDDVIFDANSASGNYTVTYNAAFVCRNYTIQALVSGVMSITGSNTVDIYGNISIYSFTSIAQGLNALGAVNHTGAWTVRGTGNQTIDLGGHILLCIPFTVDATGGTYTLTSPFICLRQFVLTNGTFKTNAFYFSCSSNNGTAFSSSNSNTRTFDISNSLVDMQISSSLALGLWDTATTTGLTFISTNSVLRLSTYIKNATFNGGGLVFNIVKIYLRTAGTIGNEPASSVLMTGSNSFNKLVMTEGAILNVTDGTTQTVGVIEGVFSPSGTIPQITGSSTGGWNLVNKVPGIQIRTDFLNVSYCTATGGGFYFGFNSVNGGNNTGITFTDAPGSATVVLDASQPNYAPALAATALSTAQWTNARAALLDNLATILTNLNSLIATVGVAGAGLTAITTQVWSAGTRILTAGTNIVLAKGTGLTGLNDIAATAIVSGGAINTSGGAVSTTTTLTNAPPDSTGVTTLLARLTALRAGYLDNLAAGAVAQQADLLALVTTVAGIPAAVAVAVWAYGTRVLTAFAFTVTTTDSANVSAIKGKTDNLPAAPASSGDVAASTSAIAADIVSSHDSIITEVDTRATPAQVLTEARTALQQFGAIENP